MTIQLSPTRFGWEAKLTLPSWTPLSNDRTTTRLLLRTDKYEVPAGPPSPAHLRAAEDLLENERAAFDSVVSGLRSYYDDIRPKYQAWFNRVPRADELDFASFMPAGPSSQALCAMFDLECIFIGPGSLGDICCALYLFRCTWEEEHGIGVAAHRRRILDVAYGSDLIQSHRYFAAGLE